MRVVRIRYVGMHVTQWVVTMPVTMCSYRHGVMHMIVMPVVMSMRVFMLR